jgi:hypothetical protein
MPFKLARQFAERAARAPSAAGSIVPITNHHLNPTALRDVAGGVAFSEIPGFTRAPIPAEPAAANESSTEQLKIQRDTYALMSGAGINVIVKNLDQQSRFG